MPVTRFIEPPSMSGARRVAGRNAQTIEFNSLVPQAIDALSATPESSRAAERIGLEQVVGTDLAAIESKDRCRK